VIVTLAIAWVVTGLVIVVAGLLAGRSRRAMAVGLAATSFSLAGLGAVGTAALVGTGYDFRAVAAASYNETVRDVFGSAGSPAQSLTLALVIAFLAAGGAVMWFRGRWVEVGLAAAVSVQIALLALGWWYFLSSPIMITAYALLWRARRRERDQPLYVTDILDARQPDHRR
jgi:hypothetical protein